MNSSDFAVEGRQLVFYHSRKKNCLILENLNIHANKGTIYGLLGPSGCGKTTLLRCIVGQLQLKGGEIRIYGRKPGERGFCIPGKGLGYMPQDLALLMALTIEETLSYYGRLFHMTSQQINDRISFLIELLEIPAKTTQVKKLSEEQKRRVSFAVALIHKPPLLLLDEPTVGVDPILRQKIWSHLRMIVNVEHTAIILTTHYVEEARHADTVSFMKEGILLAEMAPGKLMEKYRVDTLEQVFLKLSIKDTHRRKSTIVESSEALTTIAHIAGRSAYRPLSPDTIENMRTDMEDYRYSYTQNNNLDITGVDESTSALMSHTDTTQEMLKKSIFRLGTLMRKHFIHFKRNPVYTLFLVLLPVLQFILFCWAIGPDLKDLPMAVVNEDIKNGLGQRILEKLNAESIKQLRYSDLSSGIESVKSGKTWGTLYIGEKFTVSLTKRFYQGGKVQNDTIWKSSIKLHLNMINRQINFVIRHAVKQSIQDFFEHMLKATDQNPLLAKLPVTVEKPIYGSRDVSFVEYMIPNTMIVIIFIMAIVLTSMTLMAEKKDGLVDRTIAAGANSTEILFAIMFSMFLVLVLQTFLIYMSIHFIFRVNIRGSVLWLLVNVLLSGTCGMSIGLLLASISRNELLVAVVSGTVYTPIIIVSGSFWPLEALPSYLRYLCDGTPLKLLSETTRSVLTRGWGITENYIWVGPLVTLSWIILLLLLSRFSFRQKK